MQLATVFIAFSIFLGIGIIILGNTVNDCTTLPDYNATAGAVQTGWSAQCETNNTNTQSGYTLMGVAVIVIGAVVILAVVRTL